MNEQAIWKLATEGGMSALTLDRLAEETGQSPIDLGVLYPEPAYMVLVLMEDIHNRTMETMPPSTLPMQDRLTDMIMAHLDACIQYRETIQRLWGELMSMPLALLTLRPYLMKMVEQILKECGMKEDTPFAPLRLRAYFALCLYVFYTWIYDDSLQQERSLVVLDQGLKKLVNFPW